MIQFCMKIAPGSVYVSSFNTWKTFLILNIHDWKFLFEMKIFEIQEARNFRKDEPKWIFYD